MSNSAATGPLTARQQVELYRDALRLSSARAGADAVKHVLERARAHVEAEDVEEGHRQLTPRAQINSQPTEPACAVCMSEFVEDGLQPFRVDTCGHTVLCCKCAQEYCLQKIKDNECFPWLTCPAAGCPARLSSRDLLCLVDGTAHETKVKVPLLLVTKLGQKSVVKFPEWVPCKNATCGFGFFLDGNKRSGRWRRCKICKTSQRPRLKTVEPDDTIKKMIADGSLRPCPKCNRNSMKDRGVCNVIQCMKCSTYWNWRTRETGRSYAELKAKSRKDGTLWESGELGYQQHLESTDKAAFRRLLQQNGIAYNPNYKRGSG